MRKLLLVASALLAGAAHAQQYGSWAIGQSDDRSSYYAGTGNGEGGALGKLCDASGCQWVVTMNSNCNAGEIYHALLNSQAGAVPLRLQCSPNGKKVGRFIVQEFQVMEGAVTKGDLIGIAIPLESGQFRVARYPISGWSEASTALAGRVSVMLRQPGEKNL